MYSCTKLEKLYRSIATADQDNAAIHQLLFCGVPGAFTFTIRYRETVRNVPALSKYIEGYINCEA
jgi:hypothetical protein